MAANRTLTAGLENGTDISRIKSSQCFIEMMLLNHEYALIKGRKADLFSMTDVANRKA